jgi:hypothetical protein
MGSRQRLANFSQIRGDRAPLPAPSIAIRFIEQQAGGAKAIINYYWPISSHLFFLLLPHRSPFFGFESHSRVIAILHAVTIVGRGG